MIEIRPLITCSRADICRVISGYVSREKYVVRKTECAVSAAFMVELVALDQSYVKDFTPSEDDLQRYENEILPLGWSLGAFEGGQVAAIAICEPRHWNHTLWVWEFHVDEAHRGQGIGTRLMDAVAEKARAANLRSIICETQTTNVPAIRFYRRAGFAIEGIDISYYTNHDYPDGEMALFMKRRV
jgi:ribosomal protein S18 acetylase RimI-like enzyme